MKNKITEKLKKALKPIGFLFGGTIVIMIWFLLVDWFIKTFMV